VTPRPGVSVARGAEDLARLAAEAVAERLAAAVASRGRGSLCLAGGSTPRRTYELLAAPPLRDAVPWAAVHVLFGDERCVPPGDADSNYRLAREALLDRVPVPPQVHRIRGEEADAEGAATAYEAELLGAVGVSPGHALAIDVVLLGMGPDGHVASLFPGDPALDEPHRLARAVVVTAKPPPRRITLTLPALNAARAVIFLVSGAEKAAPVAAVLSGTGATLPAGRVAGREETRWILDEAAAGRAPG
jgi:6-phosphogluconolactonase